MKLKRCEIKDLAELYKPCKNQKLIKEFIESDMDIAEVVDFTQKTAYTCATSLNVTIRRGKYGGIYAMVRKGRVFLIKTNKVNKI